MEREPQQPNREPSPDPRVVRPPGALPAQNPSSGPANADRLTSLAHDLHNMIDGSMRWLSLAIASMPPQDGTDGEPSDAESQIGGVRKQVETVQTMLERMSTMVNAALRSGDVPVGSPLLGVTPSVPLGVAIDHAVDAVAPLSSSVGVDVRVTIDQVAGGFPAGPLYSVVLNGLFNAVQAIERGARTPGAEPACVEVRADYDEKRDEIVIEITDDGPGVEKGIREFAFEPGVSGDAEHSGIGLAMARQIVEQLEGVIDLNNRPDMRGAVLSVRVPVPSDETEREIG